MNMNRFVLSLCAAITPALADTGPAAPPETSAPVPATSFSEALEVFRDECVSCHRPGKTKGGLRLESLESIKAGGESGPVVIPERPAESLLFTVLAKEGDPHMPPKKQLSPQQISAVRFWLEAGMPWSAAVMNQPPRIKPVALKALPKSVQTVLAIAFSPDGNTLAAARGNSVELRDAKAERFPIKRTFEVEVDTVASLLWSSDSQTLVTGGFRQIRFWNAAEGTNMGATTDGLSGDITALCAHGDTLWAADSLASRGGFVHQLTWTERKIVKTWKAHEDSVYGLAVSPDGAWLATAGADKLARRWNAASAELTATYEGHTNQVLSVAFDPKTQRLATAGADREIKIWDRESREQDASLGDKKQVTTALYWSADGSRLASVTDKGNGAVFFAIQKHTGEQRSETAKVQKLDKVNTVLQCVTTTRDGSCIAAGAADGRIFVWNAADGKLLPCD